MNQAIKKEEKERSFAKRLLFWLPGFIVICFLLVFSVLQIPTVQTKIINTISAEVSAKTNFKIKLNYANLTWYDKVHFEKIEIIDPHDSTMISIDEARLDFGFFDLLLNRQFNTDDLILSNLKLHIIKSSDSTEVNVSQFSRELKEVLNPENNPGSKINITNIFIKNGLFTFNDTRRPLINTGKDYFHFGMEDIQAKVTNFTLSRDTINLSIQEFTGRDQTNELNIKKLNGDYFFCKKKMSLYNYELITDHSHLNDSISLFYENPNSLKHFVDSVGFYTSMNKSIVSSKDISLFSPALKELNRKFTVSGQFKGSVKRFSGKAVNLKFGDNTSIKGNLNFSGLPKIRETFIDLNISKSLIDPNDVINFVPEKYQQRILNAGSVDFKGQFLGFPDDFVANGNFNTQAGFIQSDVNLKIVNGDKAVYSGNLILKEFDLGEILDNHEVYQNINLHGTINGSGLDIQTSNFFLNATIDSVGIKNYVYKNIETNGQFANEFFEGQLKINDPNLQFNGALTIDVRKNHNLFNFQARLDELRLKPLGFSNKNIVISSSIDADIKGLHIDSIKGYANLTHLSIALDDKNLSVDSLKFISFIVDDQRIINVETDGMTGELKGNFKNSTLISNVETVINELKLKAINDTDSIENYYAHKKNLKHEPFDVELKLNLWNINPFISPFISSLRLSEGTSIDGSFKSDSTSMLTLNTHIDSIHYKDELFIDNTLDLSISKLYGSKDILASFFMSSKEQEWNKKSLTENFYLESIWANDHIDLVTNIEQLKTNSRVKVRSKVDFLKDTINFSFLNSTIFVLNEAWKINTENRIVYVDSAYHFQNVSIENEEQSIAANGVLSRKHQSNLKIDLSNFSIDNFNALFPVNLTGILDGVVEINNLENELLVESNLFVDKLKIQKFEVGDIKCLSTWENDQDRLNLSFKTIRSDKKIMDINGYFYPKEPTNQLQMTAVFDGTNLNIIQPFLRTQFDSLSGVASGNFDITGQLSNPILKGNGKITDGKVRVSYLNTYYSFHGGLLFDENEIGVENLTLYDVEHDSAIFNGGVFHDGFTNFVLDVSGNFNHFKVLNTTSVDNKLYYGTAYNTGKIDFLGTFKNLQINAKAKTENGTRLSIPIGKISEYSLEEKEYINFINLNAKAKKNRFQQEKSEEIDLKGIRLNFDVEVTNEAYVELIFDVAAGDIIRGRGNGNLNLQINTTGDFNMFGDFEIEKGGYNFTLYNIINKEFEIQKGSQISWYGDPYGANLNIQAKYRQLASLAPMVQEYYTGNNTNITQSSEIRRKYPSIVDLGITGKLLSPDIKFEINVEDYPKSVTLSDGTNLTIELETILTAFKAKLAQNEQEMKRQVFSLIILKKFSPENSFTVNSNTIGNSLSEFVSNQLSYWATQVDENLEIDVNLGVLDADAFNTFQLRLSYTFLNGRLRITRGGGFSNVDKETDVSSIIGDWAVEYLLTKDGRFRAKMYSRTNINAINTQSSNNNTQTGFSLEFVRSFDELKRILTDERNKNSIPEQSSEKNDSEAVLPDVIRQKKPPSKY